MKKLLILFMAFGFLTACNNKKGKDTPPADKTVGAKDSTGKDDKDGKEPKDDVAGDKTTDKTTDVDNTTTGWPQKDRDDFLTSCINKAIESGADRPLSEVYCECMLGKMEGKYPDVNRAGALTEDEIAEFIREYAAGCRGQ